MHRTQCMAAVVSALAASAPAFAQKELFQEKQLPGEAALTEKTIALIKTIIDQNKTGAHANRGFHAKGHGCVRAVLSLSANRSTQTRVGVFAIDKSYPAWIRFSNSSSAVGTDVSPDPRGAAIKLMGVPGTKLLVGGENGTTHDLILFSSPTSPTANLIEFHDSVAASLSQGLTLLAYLLKNPLFALRLTRNIPASITSDPLETRYFSAAPYKLGARAVKYALKPCKTNKVNLTVNLQPDALRAAMVTHLKDREGCFDLFAQFFKNERTTPIEDYAIEWKESVAPLKQIGKITIPKQSFDSPAQQTFCEDLSYNPWRVTSEHRPLGNLNRARKSVYDASSRQRHTQNATPQREPTGDEVF